MFNILFLPKKAILDAKKEKNLQKSYMVALVASIITAVSVLFFTQFTGEGLILAILALIGAFLGVLIFSFLFKVFMLIVAKKAGFYEALTTVSYGFFAMSCGYLIAGILGLIPAVGIYFSGVVLLLTFVVSNAIVLRLGVELFEADLLLIIVALVAVYVALFFSTYFMFLQTILGSFGAVTGGAYGASQVSANFPLP